MSVGRLTKPMPVGRLASRISGWWALIGLLTIAALLLRLPGIGQSLALDEMLTFDEIHGHPLADLIHQMRAHGEDNPPLYFVLAWIGAQVGDDTVAIRLPSLILSTATVPLVFVLGARTVGRGPGALAAAFAAVSPFALFYAAEARGYATAAFFSVLATLALLRALKEQRWMWWAGYAACATALLYTHYTAVFVLAAQAAWALLVHRSSWRSIVLASGAAAIAFLPWAATAKGGNFATVVGGPLRPTLSSLEALLAVFPGQPFSQLLRPTLAQFPGVTALALVGAGVVVAVVVSLGARPVRRPDATRPPSARPVALLVSLSLASPLGVFVYAVAKHDIFLSRYFSPSLPGVLLLVGWLLLRPPGAVRLVTVGLATTGMLVGTEKMFDDRFRRPPLDDMARFIRAETRPGDRIVENPLPKLAFYTQPLHAYLEGERSFSPDGGAGSEVWQRAGRGGRVAILTGDLSILPFTPARWGPGLCFQRVAHRAFRGVIDPGVAIYALGVSGRECLRAGVPIFGRGFGGREEGLAHQSHWLVAPSGRLVLIDPTRRPRTIRLTMSLERYSAPPARVLIRYPDGASVEVTAAEPPTAVRKVLRLSPGRNPITLTTRAEPIPAPQDPRKLYLRVVDLRLERERPHR